MNNETETTNQAPESYRQGDVFLLKVVGLPEGAKEVTDPGDVILQKGAATSHAHRFSKQSARLYTLGEGDQLQRYVVTRTKATLKHEEHAAIKVPPGTYQVILPRQFTPEGNANVED
jgi:hypothetical protein